jgi:hypothetical protein
MKCSARGSAPFAARRKRRFLFRSATVTLFPVVAYSRDDFKSAVPPATPAHANAAILSEAYIPSR